jgi:outer membrane protein assembly factor BamD (BamD/ComL family)
MRYLLILALPILLEACQPNNEKEREVIVLTKKDTPSTLAKKDSVLTHDCKVLFRQAKTMDSTILKQLDLNIDLANKAIRAFTDFAFYCESDSLSPVYLIKSAQIAISIKNGNQAKIVLERCISNYPKFKNKPAALFLLAQLYDEQSLLNNEEEAKKIYEQLIFDYPKSEWAKNAKGALQLLGKTDQQIINEFNKKPQK